MSGDGRPTRRPRVRAHGFVLDTACVVCGGAWRMAVGQATPEALHCWRANRFWSRVGIDPIAPCFSGWGRG